MQVLKYDDLRLTISPESLGFEKLSQIEAKEKEIVAQERAVQALTFGLKMQHSDFNVYVAGPAETGILEISESFVQEIAKEKPGELLDWCYVFNFKDPDAPIAIGLPKGMGRELQKDMSDLVDDLKHQIPLTFEGETYIAQKEEVIREFNKKRQAIFDELDKKVKAKNFILQADQTGMLILPAKEDGSPLTPEDVSKLSEEEQQKLKQTSEELQKEMAAAMRQIHKLERDVRQKLRELDRELVRNTVDALMESIFQKYSELPEVIEYLKAVREDITLHMDDFRAKPQTPPAMPFPFPGATPSFTQYEVNVIVDNSEVEGVPVIKEWNPTYPNLFGTMERKAQFGALFTDFTMIKAGALHKANGGYLILKVLDLLKWPFSYEALKRALRNKKIEIEDPSEQLGLFVTKALKPKPIPLDVKIVLTGDPFLYQLLYNYDEDFRELFKVKAHLDTLVDRNEQHLQQFLRATRLFIEKEGIRDMDSSGVARLIEYSAEVAGAKEKLSLKIDEVTDLIREADFWALSSGSDLISSSHIQKAIDQRKYRNSLYEDHLKEMLKKEIIKVATSGSVVGQVNGLAVYDLGDYMFGKPSRITANISLGKEGVINIEREAELSGKIHTKGVMILAGYLRANFAADRPLTLTASLAFEQSYGLIDGDSASGAELVALLSAIANVPLDQSKAMTGAVSQKGEILPVGGVTQKIEGFYDLCAERGLTGNQGVIIPESNIRDLMLKQDVVDSVKQGKFTIWAVKKVEEAIEIMTGMPAGERGPDGLYPEGTFYYKVDQRLKELAEEAREYAKGEEDKAGSKAAQKAEDSCTEEK